MKTSLILLLTLLSLSTQINAKKTETPIQIHWKERNNQIIISSVCFNHQYGSVIYRQCRSEAGQLFADRCRHYSEKVKYTKYPHNSDYIAYRDKYCGVAHINAL